jgi:hypothetical protein
LALRRTDIGAASALPARVRGDGAARRWALDAATLLWLLTLLIAAGYVVVFVAQFPRNIAQLGWNPSVASAYVMPETLARAGTGGLAIMGSTGLWAALWFGLLTARLPLHRELWDVAPTALFVATGLIVAWSVAQLAGRRAAILALLICTVVSPLALAFFMAPWAHNTVYPCTAGLGAYLIWLARGEGRRRLLAFALPPLAGVAVGACLASDALLAATGVIPLALTALVAVVRRERRSRLIAASALTTVAVAIPVAKLTSATMGSLGYRTLPTPVKPASLAELPARAKLLFKGLKILFNGYLGSEAPGTLHAPLGFASDVVMCAALLVLAVVGAATAAGYVGAGLRKGATQSAERQARALYVIYWVASAAAACGAFWIAGEGPVTTHESYYATAIFSVGAVIPLLLARHASARLLVPAGASVLFAASLAGMGDAYSRLDPQIERAGPIVARIAAANHVTVGYSDWADAAGLTWGTHNHVIVRPVVECQNPGGASICPGFQALVASWYAPERRRSFLLVEANGVDLGSLPEGLGKPLAEYAFGPMRMYIYAYDIASRLGPL